MGKVNSHIKISQYIKASLKMIIWKVQDNLFEKMVKNIMGNENRML